MTFLRGCLWSSLGFNHRIVLSNIPYFNQYDDQADVDGELIVFITFKDVSEYNMVVSIIKNLLLFDKHSGNGKYFPKL